MKSIVIGNQYHGETADKSTFGESFGYVSPTHILYALYIGEDSDTERLMSGYAEVAREKLAGCTHIEFKGKLFPLDKEGVKSLRDFDLGLPESKLIEIYANDSLVQSAFVRLSGEYGKSNATLRPVIENDGKWWAIPALGNKSQTIGDNVCLTGGSSPMQTGDTSGYSVPFSYETFNAGGGRVTAFEVGEIFIPIGLVECQLVANFH